MMYVKGRHTACSSIRTQLKLAIIIFTCAGTFPWEADIRCDRDTVMCPSDSILFFHFFSTTDLKTIQEVSLGSGG